MFKNLVIICLRNIKREKGYTAINVLGLTFGITCSLFLYLYIADELSYDKYHQHADNIYRVVAHVTEPEDEYTMPRTQIPLAVELNENQENVKHAVRFFSSGRELYEQGDKHFYEEGFYYVDSTVFDVFTYKFTSGDPSTSLDHPFSIVLSEKMAFKYFGTLDVLGKEIRFVDRTEMYKVTGVIQDVPHNSHFHFDALMSVNSLPMFRKVENWGRVLVFTYVHLKDGTTPEQFKPALDTIAARHVKPLFDQRGMTLEFQLQPIKDIHLYSKIQDEEEAGGDISFIYILSAIAIFILLIAAINYMNLATARSAKRAKEVGIRKVMGSFRRHLILQFIVESLVFALISVILSILLTYLLLPAFNYLANKPLTVSALLDVNILMAIGATILFVGVVGGLYPAFYLSRYQPAQVLKGNINNKGGNVFMRKSLVVVQFTISIFMLIATVIVYDQLRFLLNKDLGFSKEHVIRIDIDDDVMRESIPALKREILQDPSVVNVGTAMGTPGENLRKGVVKIEDNQGVMIEKGADFFGADYDFVETMGMKMAEGRNFSEEVLSDTMYAVLVNKAMVERMAWENPIGKKFENGKIIRKVVGVVEDFHQNSLYNAIEPVVIIFRKNNYYTHIRIDGRNVQRSLAHIEKQWNKVFPGKPFEYNFVDEAFDAQYDVDHRRSNIFTIFSILTIVIACLGLLGLTAFTTEQRSKEIGIRKAIGASTSSIVVMISREFVVLVIIAAIFACPSVYFLMNKWLEAFAYRTDMNNEISAFVLSAFFAVMIAIITVGYYANKAASVNPVNSLRSE